MTLLEFLRKHAAEDRVSFHMPGHKGGDLYRRYGYDISHSGLAAAADIDITEIAGADNLHQPQGIIRELEEGYRDLYRVRDSFLLVNGSTAGVMAAILATVPCGKKILMSRGCHRSAYSALSLGGITPVYLQPQLYGDSGVMGIIDPDDIRSALEKDDEIKAVILPSPNYYGICSDIKAIAEEVHAKGGVLIADQAHGAHLKLFEEFGLGAGMPMSAESGGADIVINSIHKTLGSFTQSALLNVVTDRVDIRELREKLNMLQSTSPSYVLMASLAINLELIKNHGRELLSAWKENTDRFYEKAERTETIRMITGPEMDKTKLNIRVLKKDPGGGCEKSDFISGKELDRYLQSRGIDAELYTGNILMAMTGIGNVESDYEKLLSALNDISLKSTDMTDADGKSCASANGNAEDKTWQLPKPGPVREHGSETEEIPIDRCEGRISAGTVIPYPPGIPFICQGEEFTGDILHALRLAAKESQVTGISEKGTIRVYKK